MSHSYARLGQQADAEPSRVRTESFAVLITASELVQAPLLLDDMGAPPTLGDFVATCAKRAGVTEAAAVHAYDERSGSYRPVRDFVDLRSADLTPGDPSQVRLKVQLCRRAAAGRRESREGYVFSAWEQSPPAPPPPHSPLPPRQRQQHPAGTQQASRSSSPAAATAAAVPAGRSEGGEAHVFSEWGQQHEAGEQQASRSRTVRFSDGGRDLAEEPGRQQHPQQLELSVEADTGALLPKRTVSKRTEALFRFHGDAAEPVGSGTDAVTGEPRQQHEVDEQARFSDGEREHTSGGSSEGHGGAGTEQTLETRVATLERRVALLRRGRADDDRVRLRKTAAAAAIAAVAAVVAVAALVTLALGIVSEQLPGE